MHSSGWWLFVAGIGVSALACSEKSNISPQEAGGVPPASGATGGNSGALSAAGTGAALVNASGGANANGNTGSLGGHSSPGITETTGGVLSGGGITSSGATVWSGGSTNSGGVWSVGGTTSNGGATSSGGARATGGTQPSSGGTSSLGGARATGGTQPSSGGTSSLGGARATGGTQPSSGGTSSLGGARATGGATGVPRPLANYTRTQGPVTLSGISNASGVAWKPETDTFFIVSNGTHSLYEYTSDFKTQLRTIVLNNGGTDTEDVVYLGSNRFGIVDENNEVYVVTIPDGASSANMAAADVEHYVVSAPPATANRGFEGVTLRPDVGAAGQFIVCQEGGVAGTPIRVLLFTRSTSSGSFSYANGSLAVQEPWNALSKLGAAATDLAAVCFDTASSTLLVLSQESSRLLRVAPETGAILDQRDLSGSPQYEGVTLASGGRLVLVSEPNYVEVYVAN